MIRHRYDATVPVPGRVRDAKSVRVCAGNTATMGQRVSMVERMGHSVFVLQVFKEVAVNIAQISCATMAVFVGRQLMGSVPVTVRIVSLEECAR